MTAQRRDVSGWLTELFPFGEVQCDGIKPRKRTSVNLVGATFEDDPDNDRVNVTLVSGDTSTATCVSTCAVGDVLCSAADADKTKLTKATSAALAAGGAASIAIALTAVASAPASVTFANAGDVVAAATIGLSAGAAAYGVVSSFRVVRKTNPDVGDYVVGTIDTQGNLTVNPFRWTGSFDLVSFGADTTGATPSSDAIRNACAAAAFSGSVIGQSFASNKIRVTKGQYILDKPITITSNGQTIEQDSPYAAAFITQGYIGPAFYLASGLVGSFPHVTNDYVGGNALLLQNSVPDYAWEFHDLRRYGAGLDLHGKAQFSIEMKVAPTNTSHPADHGFLLASSGTRFTGESNNAFVIHLVGSGFSPKNTLHVLVTTTSGPVICYCDEDAFIPDGNYHEVAVCYDGSNIRVFLDGVQIGIAAQTGTVVQNEWEQCFLGVGSVINYGASQFYGVAEHKLASLRVSDTSRHTSSYTPANAKFSSDSNTMWLGNFDTFDGLYTVVQSRPTKASTSLLPTYLPHSALNNNTYAVFNITLRNLNITNLYGPAIVGESAGHTFVDSLVVPFAKSGVILSHNCYLSRVRNCNITAATDSTRAIESVHAGHGSTFSGNIFTGFKIGYLIAGVGNITIDGLQYPIANTVQLLAMDVSSMAIPTSVQASDETTVSGGIPVDFCMGFIRCGQVSVSGGGFGQTENARPMFRVEGDGAFAPLGLTFTSCFFGPKVGSPGIFKISDTAPNGYIVVDNSKRGDETVPWLDPSSPAGTKLTIRPEDTEGKVSVALSGATHTLSREQYFCRQVNFTGALSVTCAVTVPAVDVSPRWFYNGTTGGHDVTLVANGGSTVITLTPGQRAIIGFDGTDIFKAA